MGFTYALLVTKKAVVSYTALPTLPHICMAVHFCCTSLGVASTGRYPASCPLKPGLSSPASFRIYSCDYLLYLNILILFYHIICQIIPISRLCCQLITSFILWMTCMSFYPVPCYFMRFCYF